MSAGNIASHIAVGAARSIASAATRSAIEGSSFGRAIESGLPDVIGQVIGDSLVGSRNTARFNSAVERLIAALEEADINSDPPSEAPPTSGEVATEMIGGGAPPFLIAASAGLGTAILGGFEELVRDLITQEDTWDPKRSPIETYEEAERRIASWERAFEREGMREDGFDIMFELEKARLRLGLQDGARQLDELIPGELLDGFEDVTGVLVNKTALGDALVDVAAYVSVLAQYGPDNPTTKVLDPIAYIGDRVTEGWKTDFHMWWQGRLDQNAVALYQETGDIQPLQERALKQYIRATNNAYERALTLDQSGALAQRYPDMAENFRLGFQTDLFARDSMQVWFKGLGLDPSSDSNIAINQRAYDPLGPLDSRHYRIPDLRVGDFVVEGTLWKKDLSTPQMYDIVRWTEPSQVIIVNPYDHNKGQVRRFLR